MRKIFIITLLSIATTLFANDSVPSGEAVLSPVADSAQVPTDSVQSLVGGDLTTPPATLESAGSEAQEAKGMSEEDITVLFLFIAFWVALWILAKSSIRSNHYTTAGRESGGSGSWTGAYIGRFDGSGANGRW